MKIIPFTTPSQVSYPTEMNVKKVTARRENDSLRVNSSPLLHFKVKIKKIATSPMLAKNVMPREATKLLQNRGQYCFLRPSLTLSKYVYSHP
jgi:hypothetical protein